MGDHLWISLVHIQGTYKSFTMASKLALILFGVIVFVALSAAMETEEGSELSVDAVDTLQRMVRDAEADPKRRRKNKGRKQRKNRKNKKGKKQRKNRKNRKNKKGKKQRKGQRKGQKKGQRMQGRTVDASCVTNSITYMKQWKDIVSNFEAQNPRMEHLPLLHLTWWTLEVVTRVPCPALDQPATVELSSLPISPRPCLTVRRTSMPPATLPTSPNQTP